MLLFLPMRQNLLLGRDLVRGMILDHQNLHPLLIRLHGTEGRFVMRSFHRLWIHHGRDRDLVMILKLVVGDQLNVVSALGLVMIRLTRNGLVREMSHRLGGAMRVIPLRREKKPLSAVLDELLIIVWILHRHDRRQRPRSRWLDHL